MSHYTVAIFTKDFSQDIDEMLAPFDENLKVPVYVSMTKAQLIEQERSSIETAVKRYAEWQRNPEIYEAAVGNPAHIEYIKSAAKLTEASDEDVYKLATEGYSPEQFNENGDMLSTYNPKSKWDWYKIGGRWTKWLKFKVKCPELREFLLPDRGMVSEIDFDKMRELAYKDVVPYEKAMTEGFYTEKYMREKYPTEAEYISRKTAFSTYAVITPDGEWHAAGNMGWFGLSSDTPDEEREWDLGYHDRFIRPALENKWVITIVDCHI